MIYFENFEFKKKKISNYVRDLLKSFPNKFFYLSWKKIYHPRWLVFGVNKHYRFYIDFNWKFLSLFIDFIAF